MAEEMNSRSDKTHEAVQPCPFCGVVPPVAPDASAWVVECNNRDCIPTVRACEWKREDAIATWNSRIAPSHDGSNPLLSHDCSNNMACTVCGSLPIMSSSSGEGKDEHGNLTGWRAAVAKACGNRDPINPAGVEDAVAAHIRHHVEGATVARSATRESDAIRLLREVFKSGDLECRWYEEAEAVIRATESRSKE